MNRKKLVVGLAGGAAAVSLLGVGVGASFTDAVSASQTVTAGSMNMGIDQAGGAKSYTLPAAGPEGSTFTTPETLVTTRNNGNITANAITLSASDQNNNATLKNALQVVVKSYDGPNGTGNLVTAYSGPLRGLESAALAIQGPVAPGQSDPFTVSFSATNLDSAAQGGTVIPTITVSYSG
jgi:predicted ribosomally synthesized peptide with SipW-like signal peptide